MFDSFQNTVLASNEYLYQPTVDPADVKGFTFDAGGTGPYFTSIELFGLPSGADDFDIYVMLDNELEFEAMSAGNMPYTFSEFGGVNEFEVVFDTALPPSVFDNLDVDVTFDSDAEFNGTLTPITEASAQMPEPSTVWLFGFGLLVLAFARRGGPLTSRRGNM